jgi:hypothetical protein
MAVEANWRSERGLPGRPWSKHLIHGMKPSFHPLLLPGLTEAIARGDWPAARDQLALLATALDRNTALLRATARHVHRMIWSLSGSQSSRRGLRKLGGAPRTACSAHRAT